MSNTISRSRTTEEPEETANRKNTHTRSYKAAEDQQAKHSHRSTPASTQIRSTTRTGTKRASECEHRDAKANTGAPQELISHRKASKASKWASEQGHKRASEKARATRNNVNPNMIANVRGARPRTGTDAHLSASPTDTANRNHTPTSRHIGPQRPKNTSRSKPNSQF